MGIRSFVSGMLGKVVPELEAGPPVTFTWLGMTDGKLHFTVEVHTSRRIDQINLKGRFVDADGKVIADDLVPWLPGKEGRFEPTKKGDRFDVRLDLKEMEPRAATAELRLEGVIYHGADVWKKSF